MAEGSVLVIGLGYVGLPLALACLDAGYQVRGIDTNETVTSALNGGSSHIDDISDTQVTDMVRRGFLASQRWDEEFAPSTIVICVPTPLSVTGAPDLQFVEAAGRLVAENLTGGELVILESTSYPGTTEDVLLPILEDSNFRVGKDFNCAFSPERIDPGNAVYRLANTPKVVGGITHACGERAADFYRPLTSAVMMARGTREAELSKLLENTYRHVNIALMNELARLCHHLDIDIWNVIECAETKPFGFQAFRPGPGVGGHCIPIDPNYLSHRVREALGMPFQLVELAQEINASMPSYVVSRIQQALNSRGQAVRGSRILLMGITYKANIADLRESPASRIASTLMSLGAHITFHDPHFDEWEVDGVAVTGASDLIEAATTVDIAVLLQGHTPYLESPDLAAATLILDTRGVLAGQNVERL